MQKIWIVVAVVVCFVVGGVLPSSPLNGAVTQSNFSNIRVLTDMSDRDIQLTMQSWTQQFGVTCFECHVQGDFASDARGRKLTARRMAEVVRALNQTPYFAQGSRKADCFLCHQGSFEIPPFE